MTAEAVNDIDIRRQPGRRALGIARGINAARLLLALMVPGICAAEVAQEEVTAEPREAVYGVWASSGTMIEVGPTADGGLSARIIALKNPLWREKDRRGVIGEPKTDLHNPDEALRSRPLLGLEMLSDYRFEKGRWRGRLYLPTNGSTWNSTARVRNGNLLIRGFLAISLLGRTETFVPLADCNDDIVRMLAGSSLPEARALSCP